MFVGSQIREFVQNVKFKDRLNEVEKITWDTFKYVTTSFLGNRNAENCPNMVADFVQSYKAVRCHMSARVHFLDSHLGVFP